MATQDDSFELVHNFWAGSITLRSGIGLVDRDQFFDVLDAAVAAGTAGLAALELSPDAGAVLVSVADFFSAGVDSVLVLPPLAA
jgi:hypothetical protein